MLRTPKPFKCGSGAEREPSRLAARSKSCVRKPAYVVRFWPAAGRDGPRSILGRSLGGQDQTVETIGAASKDINLVQAVGEAGLIRHIYPIGPGQIRVLLQGES